tara:strand:+ start:4434 stop:5210 length:777 start_codon:yes stop_codon:yes gene_type:complete
MNRSTTQNVSEGSEQEDWRNVNRQAGTSLDRLLSSMNAHEGERNNHYSGGRGRGRRGERGGRGSRSGRTTGHDNRNSNANLYKNKKSGSQKKDFVLHENDYKQFPQLNTDTSACNVLNPNNTQNKFKDILSTQIPEMIELNKQSLAGWSIYDKKTKKWITYDKLGFPIKENTIKENTIKENNIEPEQIMTVYKKMSDNWCNYYDEINDLLGDCSPYINYQDEIDKLVDEDNDYYSKLYEANYNSSSDDEQEYCDDEFF